MNRQLPLAFEKDPPRPSGYSHPRISFYAIRRWGWRRLHPSSVAAETQRPAELVQGSVGHPEASRINKPSAHYRRRHPDLSRA